LSGTAMSTSWLVRGFPLPAHEPFRIFFTAKPAFLLKPADLLSR